MYLTVFVAFAGDRGRAFDLALSHTGGADVLLRISTAVRYCACAMALYTGVCTLALTLGAKAIAVAEASWVGTFVAHLAVTRVALYVTLVAAGSAVKDCFLQCARPQRLYGKEHRDHRHEDYQRGEYYYGFLV